MWDAAARYYRVEHNCEWGWSKLRCYALTDAIVKMLGGDYKHTESHSWFIRHYTKVVTICLGGIPTHFDVDLRRRLFCTCISRHRRVVVQFRHAIDYVIALARHMEEFRLREQELERELLEKAV